MKELDILLAVLVLYNQRLSETSAFKSLTDALKAIDGKIDLFIYDNSMQPMYKGNKNTYKNWNIHYFNDQTNSGVSKAYNEGYKLAKKLNKKWLLLLDQDSFFQKDIFNKYFTAIKNNRDIHLFAPILISKGSICSPCGYIFKKGRRLNLIKSGLFELKKRSILNSGMLIRVSAFGESGGYKEQVWLDYSDHVFIERYKKFYSSAYIIDSRVDHGHSSVDRISFERRLERFGYYCESISHASEKRFEGLTYAILAFLRAIKFLIKYKKIEFIKVYINVFLLKKKRTQ